MKITLLVDDRISENLQPEFGLSLLLEFASESFLFDCGADSALKNNLQALRIAPGKISKVILSHGHYDHTGGLKHLQVERIYCVKSVTQDHYSFHSADDVHFIAMPPAAKKVFDDSEKFYIDSFTEIAPGIYSTGPIPRWSFEDCGGKFFHDSKCTVPDKVDEEHAILTADGVLITGCCHAGVINTVSYCRKVHNRIAIHTIVGGLHLRRASDERLRETADFLRINQIKNLYLMHCTGSDAIQKLRELLPECNIYTPLPGESWEC